MQKSVDGEVTRAVELVLALNYPDKPGWRRWWLDPAMLLALGLVLGVIGNVRSALWAAYLGGMISFPASLTHVTDSVRQNTIAPWRLRVKLPLRPARRALVDPCSALLRSRKSFIVRLRAV